jgi:predicted AAA+ superfamily ATPase
LATPGGFEVDFYLPETGQLIQVAQNMSHPATREREIRALRDAAARQKVESALILCDESAHPLDIDGTPVQIRSVSEWLIEE